ncbi:MAG: hypothetical protein KGK03_09035 [Candidatus Omnitrophica bacterium]|nr:hypothetical protein [Candidatus Omnitrophota bacterium]MDE2223199.1 hypothetical protein [Candidatus Omnitrophota bacterium]
MKKSKWIIATLGTVLLFSGCETLKSSLPMDSDRTAQAFFNDLQRSDHEAAYDLFGKGLSQRISFDQFDQFMKTIREHWGRIESDQTENLPFHQRAGEEDFIPLHVTPEQVRRYTYDVKFEDAEMNFDLTLAPSDGTYKIVWFSIWGSSIYMTPKIQEKIEELFAKPVDPGKS